MEGAGQLNGQRVSLFMEMRRRYDLISFARTFGRNRLQPVEREGQRDRVREREKAAEPFLCVGVQER